MPIPVAAFVSIAVVGIVATVVAYLGKNGIDAYVEVNKGKQDYQKLASKMKQYNDSKVTKRKPAAKTKIKGGHDESTDSAFTEDDYSEESDAKTKQTEDDNWEIVDKTESSTVRRRFPSSSVDKTNLKTKETQTSNSNHTQGQNQSTGISTNNKVNRMTRSARDKQRESNAALQCREHRPNTLIIANESSSSSNSHTE